MHANTEQKNIIMWYHITRWQRCENHERVARKKQAKSINHTVVGYMVKIKKTIEWKSRILFFIHDRLLFGKQAAERLTNLLIKGGWAIEAVAASNATLYTAVSYDMSVKRHFYLYTTHREKKNVMEH